MKYDLEERVEVFGESIIEFVKRVRLDSITQPLVRQLIRSGTSIGANYFEANQASSKKDFRNKVAISGKEANETKHWLRMIAKAAPEMTSEARRLWSEAHELNLILAKIVRTCNLSR